MIAPKPSRAPSETELRDLGFSFYIPEIEDIDVLVVDDDKTSLALMVAFLERVGHPLQAFSDPLDALDAIREKPPKILVTDMVMPNLTGLELASERLSEINVLLDPLGDFPVHRQRGELAAL